jgi:hypothetical protein
LLNSLKNAWRRRDEEVKKEKNDRKMHTSNTEAVIPKQN